MNAIVAAVEALAVTLWVGSLWSIGFVAAPVLFSVLPRGVAGSAAGALFTVVAYVGIASGVCILICRVVSRRRPVTGEPVLWLVAAMLLLVMAGHFGVRPVLESLRLESPAGGLVERFALWHGISMGLYALVSALGGVLVVLLRRNPL
jgi:hypothetical protein